MTKDAFVKTPPKAEALKQADGVLGVTRDGVKILKQKASSHFTQREALEAARKVIAARQAG